MVTNKHFCLAFLTAIVAVTGSCSLAQEKGKAKKGLQMAETWGKTVAGYKMAIKTDKKLYRLGERISLEVRLTNVGKDTRRFLFSSDPFAALRIKITVLLPDGEKVPTTQYWDSIAAGGGSARSLTLKPGEVLVATGIHLNRLFDMSQDDTYTVVVSQRMPSRGKKKKFVNVTSNHIKVAIEEDEDYDMPWQRKERAPPAKNKKKKK